MGLDFCLFGHFGKGDLIAQLHSSQCEVWRQTTTSGYNVERSDMLRGSKSSLRFE